MIDFPRFTFKAYQPYSPVYGVVFRSFCLIPPCATRVRRLPAFLTVTVCSFLTFIRVAIWGRDMKIVIITGLFWLANLAGSCYGTDIPSHSFRDRVSDFDI